MLGKIVWCHRRFFNLLQYESIRIVALTSVPREIRTPDLLVRSQTLYPAELWRQYPIRCPEEESVGAA